MLVLIKWALQSYVQNFPERCTQVITKNETIEYYMMYLDVTLERVCGEARNDGTNSAAEMYNTWQLRTSFSELHLTIKPSRMSDSHCAFKSQITVKMGVSPNL